MSRRRFLASIGVSAAGGAAVALAATQATRPGAAPSPAPSPAALSALAETTPAPSPSPKPDYSAFRRHFRSRPDLVPPQVLIQVPAAAVASGLLFYTPSNGDGSDGPAIFDDRGELVWMRPDSGVQVADLQVVELDGEPHLAWWEGTINGGIGTGDIVLADRTYREVRRIQAGNGRRADLHEFHVTPRGTALLLADAGVPASRASGGSSLGGEVLDCAVQEIDLGSGQVLFEWHSVDHIGLGETYVAEQQGGAAIHDYVHVNAVDLDQDGNLLVCARNTSAVYKVDRSTGTIIWRLGGKRSDFTMGPGTQFGWQHDARRQPDGTLTLFDDNASPVASRGLVLRLDEAARTATLVRAYSHPARLFARSQGNVQVLPGGNVLVGWGDTAYVSEFAADGRIVFDATYPAAAQSYRNYRRPWAGQPHEAPSVAAVAGPGGAVTAFASWNGATEVASWEILAGASSGSLAAAGSAARSGFETTVAVRGRPSVVRAVARDAGGSVLGSSPVVSVAT